LTSAETKPRDLSNIVNETFRVYKANFIRLIAIVAIVEVIQFAIGAIVFTIMGVGLVAPFRDWEEWVDGDVGLLIVSMVIILLFSFILYSLMEGALIHAITGQYTKRPIEIARAYIFVWRRIGALLGAVLLAGIAVGAMAITIIGIPFAVYFGVRWFGVPQAVILEAKSPREALSRSSDLVKNTWWRVAGILVVLVLIVGAMGGILGITLGLIPWIGESLVMMLVAPIGVIGATLLYYDLVFRKEGHSLELMTR